MVLILAGFRLRDLSASNESTAFDSVLCLLLMAAMLTSSDLSDMVLLDLNPFFFLDLCVCLPDDNEEDDEEEEEEDEEEEDETKLDHF